MAQLPAPLTSTRPLTERTEQGPFAVYLTCALLLATALTLNGLTGQRFGLMAFVNATRTGSGVGADVGPGVGSADGGADTSTDGSAEALGDASDESAAKDAPADATADGAASASSAGETTGWAQPAPIRISAIPATAVLRMMASPSG